MAYDDLVGRLDDPPAALDVAAFPDGSVDSYYQVCDGDRRLATREEFVATLTAGRSALQLADRQRFPGGQTVNMAQQAAALHDSVHLVGHLDDPIFESLPFETASMGAPADVSVLRFDDENLMLAARSPAARKWRFEQLQDAVDPETFLDVDLICCGNARVFDDLGRAAEQIAASGSGGTLVYDPGDVTGWTPNSQRALVEALAKFERDYRTVLSANEPEIEALAAALPSEGYGDDRTGQAERIRDRSGITGVVAHTEQRAVAATAESTVDVPNLDTERVETVTGAGDRFTAALGHGLAAGWPWEPALQLGHACASYHVVHGETVSFEGIADYVEPLETV